MNAKAALIRLIASDLGFASVGIDQKIQEEFDHARNRSVHSRSRSFTGPTRLGRLLPSRSIASS